MSTTITVQDRQHSSPASRRLSGRDRRDALRGRAPQPTRPLTRARLARQRESVRMVEPVEPGWLHEPAPVVETPWLFDPTSLVEPCSVVETAETPPRVRLTRRGQAVASTIVATALVALGVLAVPALSPVPVPATATQTHVVEPGETLWGIALEAGIEVPTRDVVDRIEEINGLDSAMLQPGQQLTVPVAG